MRVLYVAYWGALEPLGQSVVLPAVLNLAARGVEYTLVTFEKTRDLADRDAVARTEASLAAAGVRWRPLVYHKSPQVPAKVLDFVLGSVRGVREGLRGRFDLIHARTFIGGVMSLSVASATRTPLVYHNEGFYPDEQVDGGIWREGSWRHRIAKAFELRLYRKAAGIVVLSSRAVADVRRLPGCGEKPVVVVPSAVDLGLFHPEPSRVDRGEGPVRLVYAGSLGGRYLLDRMAQFCVSLRRAHGRVHLRVLTSTDPQLVRDVLTREGLQEDEWSLDRVPHASVPAEIGRCDAGLAFLTQGGSEHGGSPTKVGEYWACGLPVVTTANVGDVEEIIGQLRVGVVIREHDPVSHSRAAEELRSLLADPEHGARCRVAAERYYSLEVACDRLLELYRSIIGR